MSMICVEYARGKSGLRTRRITPLTPCLSPFNLSTIIHTLESIYQYPNILRLPPVRVGMREYLCEECLFSLRLLSEGGHAAELSARHPLVLQLGGDLSLPSGWQLRRVSELMTLGSVKTEDSECAVLHARLSWPEDRCSPPDVAVFKRQVLLPLMRATAGLPEVCILAAEEREAMLVLLVLLLTRALLQGGRPEEVTSVLLPWTPTAAELTFASRVARAAASDSRRATPSIASLCGVGDGVGVLGLKRSSVRPLPGPSTPFQLPPQELSSVKPLPSEECGLTVCEFFSGVGGMRLSLPSEVSGRPIRRFIAFECSEVANRVYRHNFSGNESTASIIRGGLIETVKLREFEGEYRADIWTMSPPCQPFTKTRGARRLGSRDNRNKGIFFLMEVLLRLSEKPRWIVVENVAAFRDSDVAALLTRVLDHCGYSFREYTLSPIQFGVPNNRLRYYLIAEYGSRLKRQELCLVSGSLPPCKPIGDYLLPESEIPEHLFLSHEVLGAPWAVKRISVVGRADRSSHCFTKGYGRVIDRSTGSCLLADLEGTVSESEEWLHRESLVPFHRRIRLFHPTEMLGIAGFPSWFTFPPGISVEKQFACIGNSINVTVVAHVMRVLFGVEES